MKVIYSCVLSFLIVACVYKQQSMVRSGGDKIGSLYYDLNKGLDALSSDLKAHLAVSIKSKNKKIAIASFVNAEGKPVELGRDVAAGLQKRMFDPARYRLLERARIDSLLKEMEFTQSGMVGENETPRLGQMLGADIMLVGGISVQGNHYLISARAVDIATGEVLAIGELQVYAQSSIEERYNKAI